MTSSLEVVMKSYNDVKQYFSDKDFVGNNVFCVGDDVISRRGRTSALLLLVIFLL